MLDPQNVKKIIEKPSPIQQFCKVEDIADSVLFLSSEGTSFIKGAVLRLEGG